MSVLLEAINRDAVDRDRRTEAEARPTCDYCGHPFVYSYSGLGMDGPADGWRHAKVLVRINGRYHVVYGERCRERLVWYLQSGKGRVPRLVGRETVEEVMR